MLLTAKRTTRRILTVLCVVAFQMSAHNALAQLIKWDPSPLISTFGPSPWTPTILDPALTSSGLIRGSSLLTGSGAASGCYGSNGGWATGGGEANSFYFSITAACSKVSLTTISGYTRRSTTGPTGCDVSYSLNGGAYVFVGTWTTSSTSGTSGTPGSTDLSTVTALQNIAPGTLIKIKFTPIGTTGNWYFTSSSLALTGTVTAVTTPTIATSPTPVLIPVTTGTSFTVSGVTSSATYQWQRNTSGLSGGTWDNITSATLDPTGTYSGYTTTSSATSNTLTLSGVPATWDGYAYRCVVTNCAGTATSAGALLNVISGSCAGTPVSGTATATPSSFCGSGSSALGVTGGSTSAGLTYQWISSPTGTAGSFTNISGATAASYTTPTLTTTTYYRLVTTCTASASSDTSTVAIVTIKTIPTISTTPAGGNICSSGSGLSMTASGASTYTWSPATGLSATAGATVTANPTVTTTYTITGTSAGGCSATTNATVNYNLTPTAMGISPSSSSLCAGSPAQLLTATGATVSSVTNSGVITIPGSIGAFGTISNSQLVSGIPAGAVITGAAVNIISFGAQYQDDYIINIAAPNGDVLNLITQHGTHTSAVTTLFANTNVSSTGVTPVASGSGTFTGTWAAEAINGVGAAPYLSNVTEWNSLFSVPNGAWTLSVYNNTAFGNNVVSTAQWSITIYYQAPVTWSPTTHLYTDAATTLPYTGGIASNVYTDPSAAGSITYTATATNSICTVNATAMVTVNPLPATITGTMNACEGLTTTLADATSGGTWSSSDVTIATVDASGVVTGIAVGTTSITYTAPTGCVTTTVVTVNPLPTAITGTMTVCETSTTSLSDASTGGTWSSSSPATATIDASGIVTGVAAGPATITYTLATGCISTAVITVIPLPAAITGTMTACEGLTTTLTDAIAGGSWSSSDVTVATIDAISGIVTGIVAGTAEITYTLPTGCAITTIVTINPLPAAITGTMAACEASTTSLADATTGGTWSSSATGIATIDASGVVTGVLPGNATITYTLGTGCIATAIITVNPLPSTIAGTMTVCEGLTTSLTNAAAGGTWTSGDAVVATIDATGVVTGLAAGTSNITYTIPTGCTTTAIVTVNSLPAAITGTLVVCEASTTILSDATAGGTWSSSTTGTATVDGTGVVTGVAAGTATATYTLGTGCITTAVVTVNPLPTAITGTMNACEGLTTTLTDATGGGTWASGNITVATIDAAGVVTGLASGTSDITYTLATGCKATAIVTINALPAAITGIMTVCPGTTTTLHDAVTGGTWSSSFTAIASIDAVGVVTGAIAGTTTITYTLGTGCMATAIVTVNSLPAAITGTLTVCQGLTTTLADATAGGTWASSTTSVATIATGGVVTGVTAGTTTITYTAPTSCISTAIVTVNPLPGAIVGTLIACPGTTTTLTNTGGGTWSTGSSNATVNVTTGIVTGVTAGTASITYTLATGCTTNAVVTVNTLPAAITGANSVCQGLTITLNDATGGGTWTSSANATVGATNGVVTGVTAGNATITYTGPNGCTTTHVVTINPLPGAITGTPSVCVASTTTLANTGSGTWSSNNGNATIGSSTGIVTGVTAGTSVVTYTLSTSCITTRIVTINALPSTITGTATVCVGLSTTLSNAGGGTWSTGSSNAFVGSTTGAVVGITAGTATITYTLATGCATTKVVTVNPLPGLIGGTPAVCVGSTTTLTNTGGGTWSSSNSNATIGSSTGIVTGITAGTATITYTLPTGCIITTVATVDPLPSAISGTTVVCVSASTTLTDAGTGTWSSSNGNAIIGATTGIVTGMIAGTSTITYTLPTGCIATTIVTVNAQPTAYAVTGGGGYCVGGAGVHIGLSNSNTGISYQLYSGSTAIGSPLTGTGTALDFGIITPAGTYTVSATNVTTSCGNNMSGSAVVIINPLLTPEVSLSASVTTLCSGSPATFMATPVNGGTAPIYEWKVNGTVVGTSGSTYVYTATDGDVISVKLTSNATCATPDTAITGDTLTVIPAGMPSLTITASPSNHVCSGTMVTFTAIPTLGGSSPSFRWTLNGVNVATGPTYSLIPGNGDVVYGTLLSDYACRLADSVLSPNTTLTVDPPATAPVVTIAASPGLSFAAGETVTFTATVTGGGTSPTYQWQVNGVSVAGATNNTYTTNALNNHDLVTCSVVGTGACGLASFNSVFVTITSTGIDNMISAADIRIMPNPNKGTFVVAGSVSANQPVTLEVTNMLGQVVVSRNVELANGKLNEQVSLPNNAANGVYLVTLRSAGINKVMHVVVEQ